MKKHLLLLVMLAAMTLIASATPVTPVQALGRLSSGSPMRARKIAGSAPSLAYTLTTPTTGEAAIYVFTSQAGTLITPADDAAPALIGYTSASTPEEIPANMMAWLQGYADQIEYLRASGAGPLRAAPLDRPQRTPIAPLTTTQWNQAEPYNNMCPIDPNSSRGARCVTGCVATAMAQVMRWHQWPLQGVGIHSYAWNEQSLSFNFGATTFDYANMLDVYDDNATQTQQDAVATLMSACGVAVDMQYSSSSSGAYGYQVPVGIHKYFNYDEHINYAAREYYSTLDWEALIYDQLEKIGPVLYCGTSTGGGHEFVCDGYSADGLFHINWGWGGKSDGYFLLTTLNPYEQGIGGGSNSGFTYNAGIVADMHKDYGHGTKACVWRGNTDVTLSPLSAPLGTDLTMSLKLQNKCMKALQPTLGLGILNEDGTTTLLSQASLEKSFAYDDEQKVSLQVSVPATVADGSYVVVPMALEEDGIWHMLPVDQTKHSVYSLEVSDGNATLSQLAPTAPTKNVELQSVDFTDGNFANGVVKARITISNPYETPWELPLFLGLNYPDGHDVKGIIWISDQIDESFEGFETKTFDYEFDFTDVDPGEYRLAAWTYSKMFLTLGAYSRLGDFMTINLVGADPETFTIESEVQVEPGKTAKIPVYVTPAKADETAEWTSSDETVCTVDQKGTVTGVGLGTAVVTATSPHGFTATCTVSVVEKAIRPFPATVNNVIYDYTDETCTALKVVQPVAKAFSSSSLVLETEIDGIPVTTIGELAFSTSDKSPKMLVIPEGYTTIEAQAFKSTSTYSLTLPSTITSIAPNAFTSSNSVKKIFNHMDPSFVLSSYGMSTNYSGAIYHSGEYADSKTKNAKIRPYPLLADMFEAGGLYYIPTSAKTCDVVDFFNDGKNTPAIDIPEVVSDARGNKYEVQGIGDYAFYWAYYTTRFTIPSTIKNIGTEMLYYGTSFDLYCYINGPDHVTLAANAVKAQAYSAVKGTLHVCAGLKEAFEADPQWGLFPSIVEMSVPAGPKINLDVEALTMHVGDTTQIGAACSPASYFTEEMVWASSDESVATVDQEGNVEAVGLGEATITVSANDVSATATVRVIPMPSATFPVTIDKVTYDYADENLTSVMVKKWEGGMSDYDCTILSEVDHMPVTKIGPQAFKSSRVRRLVIPSSVNEICDSAFYSSIYLTALYIPRTVKKVGTRAFFNVSKLAKIFCESTSFSGLKDAGIYSTNPFVIYMPGEPEVTEFQSGKYRVVPSVEDLFSNEGGNLFFLPLENDECMLADYHYASSFKNVEIPSQVVDKYGTLRTVTEIGRYALYNDYPLTTLVIPSTVRKIGLCAVKSCSKLASVTVNAAHPDHMELEAGVFTGSPVADATLTVPYQTAEHYKVAEQWMDFGSHVEMVPVGVEAVEAARAWTLCGGSLSVAEGCTAVVTDLAGRTIARMHGGSSRNLPAGIYILAVEGEGSAPVVSKVVVK